MPILCLLTKIASDLIFSYAFVSGAMPGTSHQERKLINNGFSTKL
jgi:hypothetical protein